MSRKKFIEDKLKEIDAETGDEIQIIKKTDKKKGILMPHHEFSNDDIITIKLKNGYNVGVAVDQKTEINLVKKHKESVKKTQQAPLDPKKPTVSIIGTGGTIACYVDYRTGAVHPATNAQELAFSVPEIFDIFSVSSIFDQQLNHFNAHKWIRYFDMPTDCQFRSSS